MTKVNMKTQIPVSVEKMWELIGGFNAVPDWHPAVEKSELEEGGKIRRLSLVGGGSIVERLERIDDNEHVYRYSILESPLPVADYVAELRVRPNDQGEGCTIEWSSEFNPKDASDDDAMQVIQGVYQAGFDNLKKLFGG
ncbi:MAG: SRPBCC family protein [Acidiferrobacterales bacterium]